MPIESDTLPDHAVVPLLENRTGTDILLGPERDRSERLRAHRRDTEDSVQSREREIDALRKERHDARIELCSRLGDFGFAYSAVDHSITKISLVAPPAELAEPQPTRVPEPFDPVRYGLPSTPPEAFAPKLLKWIDRLAWCAVPFLGAFVGYSIGLLAGLPVKAQVGFAVASVAFGAALLATMKGSLYAIVHAAGRRAAVTDCRGYVWTALAIALLLVIAEVGLGATAVRRYSEDRALSPEEVLPWLQAILVALCFSTPMLLASVAKGWIDGGEHDSTEAKARAEAERHHRETAAALREHEAELRRRDEEVRARREKALADFEAANERYREDDRWKTAMSLYGAIGVYDREIEEREALLKGFKIGRGFSLAGEARA